MFDSLKKGDGIMFEAVVVGLGSEYKMHHLHALSVSKTSSFKSLDDIIVRESALPWKHISLKKLNNQYDKSNSSTKILGVLKSEGVAQWMLSAKLS